MDTSKAGGLLRLMNASREEAVSLLPDLFEGALADLEDIESPFTTEDDMARNGCVEMKATQTLPSYTMPYHPFVNAGLDVGPEFKSMGVGRSCHAFLKRLEFKQIAAFSKNSVLHQPTGGYFDFMIDIENGFLGAIMSTSPQHIAHNKDPPKPEIPLLNNWSDVAFNAWRVLDRNNLGAPRYIARIAITNTETRKIVDQICKRWKGRANVQNNGINPWNPAEWKEKMVFGMDTEEGKLLLQTPGGKGVAWFLIQHKVAFGVKTVKEVMLFRTGGLASLIFSVGDVNGMLSATM